MKKNEDRRIRKTKKAMSDALASLLLKKPLNNISVREIAELADINRGTFYLHYRDVYDMVEQLQNEIFEKFNEIIDNYEPKSETDSLFPLIVEVFNLLADNSELAKVLISKNGDAIFLDKLKNLLRDKCLVNVKKLLKIKNEDEFQYYYDYIIAGCTGLFGSWLAGGMKETPVEMAGYTEEFIMKGADIFK